MGRRRDGQAEDACELKGTGTGDVNRIVDYGAMKKSSAGDVIEDRS